MATPKAIAKMVTICNVLCLCHAASGADQTSDASVVKATVTIEITKLEVNDSNLTLSYRIRNEMDREAWVCSSISAFKPFEIFLTSDKQTLLIRGRQDIPTNTIWDHGLPRGTFVRVPSHTVFMNSMDIALPVSPYFLFAVQGGTLFDLTARRLAIEISYFDEDLPAMIHDICAVANRFPPVTSWDVPSSTLATYFPGLGVRNTMMNFDALNPDPYGQGRVYIYYPTSLVEKVLHADVNGVCIRYKGCIEASSSK
jgi:hypothetical protein